MYKKSKTFHPVNMFRELLASPALFKTFVYFEKKRKKYIHYIIIWYWIHFANFIYCTSFDKANKNKIYVSKHEAWIAQNHIAFFHFDKMQISVT